MRSPGDRQQGMALIMVLLAMALLVLLTTGMTQQQSVRIFRAGHYLAQQQGYSVALGVEELAKQFMYEDYELDKEDSLMVDSLNEDWAQYSVVYPLDDRGVAEAQINDLGGKLNLNDLVTPAGEVNTQAKARIERLLEVLDARSINVDALIDWIDSNDQAVSARGAEDGAYLVQDPSYRAANQYFTSVTELRLIREMTEEDYQKLKPYVVALPVSGLGINVNMAPAVVLQTLHEQLSEASATAIVAQREEAEEFENIQDFLALPEFAGLGLKADGLTLQTRFFDVVSRVTYDDRSVSLVSTLYRGPNGEMQIVRRDSSQKVVIDKDPFPVSEG